MERHSARRRALVVEDDGAVRELLADTLELRGFDVVCAERAEEALALLEGGPAPDLVVLDRLMPGMSGDDLLRRMRATPAWARVPVAIVSGVARREAALAAEPDAYLEKPFDADVLDDALDRIGHAHEAPADGVSGPTG